MPDVIVLLADPEPFPLQDRFVPERATAGDGLKTIVVDAVLLHPPAVTRTE